MKYVLYFFALALLSCSKGKNQAIMWDTRQLEAENCVGKECAKVSLSYPIAAGGAQSEVINATIETQLQRYLDAEDISADLEKSVENFLQNYIDFKEEFPDAYGQWSLEVEARVSHQSDSLLSVYFEHYVFTGGAHPNSSVYFLNFDPQSGEVIERDQLILNQEELLSMTEESFRAFHQIPPDQDLKESGQFFLPETGFFLPQAIGFREDSLYLIYIPYEIGPYVMGYTELSFAPEQVRGIVRK
ncbi:MAG: DUF3298 and DUF4163 domain-containing protein [Bacteroidota bacterium]